MEKHHPPIIIIAGAIGSGKGTIVQALVYEMGLKWVKTHTTRPMRQDDYDLSNRIFDTSVNFLRHIERNEFIEHIELAGNYYGLLRADLDHELKMGQPVVIEMTVDGALNVAREYPQALLIFIKAPERARREHIQHRNMDPTVILKRMRRANEEEKIAAKHFDYLVENPKDHPEEAIENVKKLIREHFPEINDKG